MSDGMHRYFDNTRRTIKRGMQSTRDFVKQAYSKPETTQAADSNGQIASVDEAKDQLKKLQEYKTHGRHPEILSENELVDFRRLLDSNSVQVFLALDDNSRFAHFRDE